MKNLNREQLKGIAQFLNTVSATWFSAGVISPFFIPQEDISKFLAFASYATIMSVGFLWTSLKVLGRVK